MGVQNFTIDGAHPVGATSMTRAQFIDVLQYLQYASGTNVYAFAAVTTNGLVARIGSGGVTVRTLAAPAAGLAITNPGGVAGDPTFALANDLAALEGLALTGVPKRTATDAWAILTPGELRSEATNAATMTGAGAIDVTKNTILYNRTGAGATDVLTLAVGSFIGQEIAVLCTNVSTYPMQITGSLFRYASLNFDATHHNAVLRFDGALWHLVAGDTLPAV